MTTQEIVTEYLSDANAIEAQSIQLLEIAGYEQLRRVAERAGDATRAEMVGRILREERHAAESLTQCLEQSAASR